MNGERTLLEVGISSAHFARADDEWAARKKVRCWFAPTSERVVPNCRSLLVGQKRAPGKWAGLVTTIGLGEAIRAYSWLTGKSEVIQDQASAARKRGQADPSSTYTRPIRSHFRPASAVWRPCVIMSGRIDSATRLDLSVSCWRF